jgi:hypothetical protein
MVGQRDLIGKSPRYSIPMAPNVFTLSRIQCQVESRGGEGDQNEGD